MREGSAWIGLVRVSGPFPGGTDPFDGVGVGARCTWSMRAATTPPATAAAAAVMVGWAGVSPEPLSPCAVPVTKGGVRWSLLP